MSYFGNRIEGFDKELALKIQCESFMVNSCRSRIMNNCGYDTPSFENTSKLIGFNAFRAFRTNQTLVRKNFAGLESLMKPPYSQKSVDLFK